MREAHALDAGRRFQQLQWKLTFSYTLVTVGALLLVELLLLGGGALLFDWLVVRSGALAQVSLQSAQQSLLAELQPLLAQTPPDSDAIDDWLDQFAPVHGREAPPQFVVLAGDGSRLGASELAQRPTAPQFEAAIAAAQAGVQDAKQLTWRDEAGGRLWQAVPVFALNANRPAQVLGVLLQGVALPQSPAALFGDVLPVLGASLLMMILLASAVGTIFGWLTARGLVRRLARLAAAANAWSAGDFSKLIPDHSADEMGQLAQQLNRMAAQLQHLLLTRQQVAVLEERNRLALDLHDSTKQQAFALSAQLGAAKTLLPRDPERAAVHLADAEAIADTLRHELANLVYELRPAPLEGKLLGAALNEYAQCWAEHNAIQVAVQIENRRSLPPDVEQALFRIAQEALANVSRHSQALRVTLTLHELPTELALAICDDGRGFDVSTVHLGVGLDSMRQRAAAIGAQLSVASAEGKGTCISVVLRNWTWKNVSPS